METGTQILIDRMKTHPEEFVEGAGPKWAKALAYANQWLPEEDKQAIDKAIAEMRINGFNELVLKTLAGEAEPEKETIRYKASERYSAGFSDPRAFTNAVMNSKAKELSDHIDAHSQIVSGIREWTKEK